MNGGLHAVEDRVYQLEGRVEKLADRVSSLEAHRRDDSADRDALIAQLQEMNRRLVAALTEMARVTGELAVAAANLSEYDRKLDQILKAVQAKGEPT